MSPVFLALKHQQAKHTRCTSLAIAEPWSTDIRDTNVGRPRRIVILPGIQASTCRSKGPSTLRPAAHHQTRRWPDGNNRLGLPEINGAGVSLARSKRSIGRTGFRHRSDQAVDNAVLLAKDLGPWPHDIANV